MFTAILLLLQVPPVTGRQAGISQATARTVWNDDTTRLSNAVDGQTETFYESSHDDQPEWLELTLDGGYSVEKVVVINR